MSEQMELTDISQDTEPESPFEHLQRVIDTDAEDPEESVAIVLDPCAGIASEYKADGQYVSEYESNKDYPDDDAVVVVVFLSGLDGRVTNWEDMLGEDFREQLEAYSEKWGVPIDKHIYEYPSERLEPHTEE